MKTSPWLSFGLVCPFVLLASAQGQVLISETFAQPAASTSAFLAAYSPPWMEQLNPLNNEITVPPVSFTETFATLAAGTAAFEGAYSPPWFLNPTADDPNEVSVADVNTKRVMTIKEIVQGSSTRRTVLINGYNASSYAQIVVEADIGSTTNNGWFDVGMDLGDVYITFSPGYAAEGGRGWFKVNNNWGIGDLDGTDMGFVPANFTLHHMKVIWNQQTAEFDITITDGDNPSNVFHYLWTHPTAVSAAGKPLGLIRYGSHDHLAGSDGQGLYDNFTVTPQNGDSTSQLYVREIEGQDTDTYVSVPGYDANSNPELMVEADVGASSSGGLYGVGLNLGGVVFDFSPGKATFPRGAFRIDNQWGPGDVSDTDMGFTPANQVLHHVSIHWKQKKGQFDVTITDGANPANVFHYSFSNASAVSAGGHPIGVVRDGVDDQLTQSYGYGLYDNFKITNLPVACPGDVFADADGDGDVDADDFGAFQRCYTGASGGVPTNPIYCVCMDHDNDGDIDADDLVQFEACSTRAGVLFDLQNPPPGCVP